MTPQIALDLSLDGIAVLSRAPDGPDRGKWYRQGIVRLDASDMAERLRRLRRRCAEVAGDDFTSILVIPDTQLLFTSLERDDRDPRVTIRSQLAGRTPYAIDDLAFDYTERGDRLQVAVVARETLREAESFAADFGFRPVAHIAAPRDPSYDGIAQFGPTALAPSLTDGARVSLDLRRSFEVVPAPMPKTPADAAHEESTLGEPAGDAEVEADSGDPAPDDGAGASAPPDDGPPGDPARDFAALVAAAHGPVVPSDAAGASDAPAGPPALVLPASVLPDGLPPAQRPPSEPVMVKPPVPSAAAGTDPVRPAFSSRRKPGAASAPLAPRLGAPRLAAAPAPPMRARAEPPAAGPAADAAPDDARDAGHAAPSATPPEGASGEPAPSPKQPDAEPAPEPTDDAPATAPDATPPRRPAALAAMDAALRAPPGRPGGRLGRIGDRIGMRPSAPATVPPASRASPMAADGALSEAQALSLPGRGRMAKTARRGPARLGLYLTLTLLAVLGAIALWAVVFAPDGSPGNNAMPVGDPAVQLGATDVEAAPAPPAEPAETDLASLLPEAGTAPVAAAPSALVAPPMPLAEEMAEAAAEPPVSLTGEDGAELIAGAAPEPDAPLPGADGGGGIVATGAPDATEALALAGRFDDGPGLAPPPEARNVTDIYLASIDPAVADGDAVALPAASAPADAFAPQTSPPPAGTDMPVGADGLVEATTEGVTAPGGYRLIAGQPETMPDPRAPDTPAAVAATAPEIEARLAELRRVRPTARPDDAEARVERASFGGLSRVEITRIRPSQRPEAIVAQAAALEAETVAAAAQAAAAIAAAEDAETNAAVQAATASAAASLARPADIRVVEPIGEGSRYALAASDRPLGRPRSVEQDAARIVTARRESASAPAPQAQAAAPQAPSSGQTFRSAGGSVARAATESNAIRLREINLIGVYGRAADRRALVRLSNGRYVKVKVGDQLDRGRVMAIGESEVVYQRGGRNVALRMPST